jgi:hypothetical protein
MVCSTRTIAKKTFSLAIIFNALMTLACVGGILTGFYLAMPYWQPYAPYLLSGNILWFAIAAALINIFPGASIGRTLHTGRFLFHHYVYGCLILLSSSIFVLTLTNVPLFNIFLVQNNGLAVNGGRVFLLGGLTLLIDDLPDVSKKVKNILDQFKKKAYQARKALHVSQMVTGAGCLYCALSIILSTLQNSAKALPNSFLIGTLIVTGITSFACAKRKMWLNITPTLEAAKRPSLKQGNL